MLLAGKTSVEVLSGTSLVADPSEGSRLVIGTHIDFEVDAACMSVSQSYGSPLLLTLVHLARECVNVEGDSSLLHLSRTVSPLYIELRYELCFDDIGRGT
jgi:hypothetical protein